MENSILAKDMVRDYTSSYATYVATSRSVCSLLDGLKPVQRRCINSADDIKLYHNKKHLKVSKLIGDVLGSYHPHGGANPVPMAQPFRFRYPMFEGQGNYGSPDMPDSYAAYRYLEIRLSKFTEDFYLESVDYADREENYDGRLKEVTQYYPVLPGCLFTGASGIAVGFSTEIPMHTISDIGNSLLAYIKNPNSKRYLKGLYPETCEKSLVLTPVDEIRQIYETGEGSVRYQASMHYETVNGMKALVVDAFPPGFSKKKLNNPYIMEVVDKGLLEVSNESAEEIRYVFTSPDEEILEYLEGRLTSSVGYRMYIEHRGVIKLYKLHEIYDTFIEEKSAYIVRKYSGIIEKLSYNRDYLLVLLELKKDKQYIKDMFDKTSEEVVKDIQSRYNTTEKIARRIISATLRTLMADNMDSIEEEIKGITNSIEEYQGYINDPISKISNDIKAFMKLYKNDERRATHVDNNSDEITVSRHGKNITVYKSKSYLVGTADNSISILYGADILNLNLYTHSVVPLDYEYYFFYDGKGCCTVNKETILKSGNKFNSNELRGIIGINSLDDITIKQGNGKVYKGVSWSLRKKIGFTRLSKDSEPDFEVIEKPESMF